MSNQDLILVVFADALDLLVHSIVELLDVVANVSVDLFGLSDDLDVDEEGSGLLGLRDLYEVPESFDFFIFLLDEAVREVLHLG